MRFKYVVIILVDWDDLLDCGVVYFVVIVCEIKVLNLECKVEIFVLDFCGCVE